MKKIEDYLHLYIGCDTNRGMLIGLTGSKAFVWRGETRIYGESAIVLFLRPLSDMTEEEMQECGNMIYDFSDDPELNTWEWQYFQIGLAPEQLYYLLKKGFDLFNLIPEGLAIDKTKIKQQ